MGEKVHGREGKSPEKKLRVLIFYEVEKEDCIRLFLGGGLGSSHPLKKA